MRLISYTSLLLAIAITLAARGYQFGGGNHAIYLPAALRELDPKLLAADWWTTGTLQYHFVFTHLSAALMRWHLIEPAFLAGYLALAALLHLAWLRLVRAVGGSERSYLVSVALYYLSAGGYGLGMYEFLQDSSFLPSNVANVAMLWAMAMWLERRPGAAAACLGLAGMWHLNHAIVAVLLWAGLNVWNAEGRRQNAEPPAQRRVFCILHSAFLLLLCLPTLLPAAATVLHQTGRLPLSEFVDLYVRLRHPHHYDPASWPAALWVAVLWPVPLAWVAFCGRQQARRVMVLISALLLVALLGAGVWYVSESLVQMSLWRFSIYLKLLGCIGAAKWLLAGQSSRNNPQPSFRGTPRNLAPSTRRQDSSEYLGMTMERKGMEKWLAGGALALILAATVVLLAPHLPLPAADLLRANAAPLALLLLFSAAALLFVVTGPRVRVALAGLVLVTLICAWPGQLGLRLSSIPEDEADYLALCAWVRDNTPVDAVFLVPPQENSFRLHARRAIVVNFKAVPQLSGELPEWRDRLRMVLDLEDLGRLPRRYDRTLAAIGEHYAALPPEQLLSAARRYGATYVVTEGTLPSVTLVNASGRYRLYQIP